jgi:hypothetical protein
LAKKKRDTDAARPAPFTPEQVAALVSGAANQTAIAKVLAAHRQPRLPERVAKRKGPARTAPAPVALTAGELRELATGTTPEKIATILDTTASRRRRTTAGTRKATIRPKRRPPLS